MTKASNYFYHISVLIMYFHAALDIYAAIQNHGQSNAAEVAGLVLRGPQFSICVNADKRTPLSARKASTTLRSHNIFHIR